MQSIAGYRLSKVLLPRMVQSKPAVGLTLCLTVAIFVIEIYMACIQHYHCDTNKDNSHPQSTAMVTNRRFAVFGCSTPDKTTHRVFDYAFYLPLTVFAWRRIGFETILLIIGDKTEWKTHPVLSYVLDQLDKIPDTTMLFISAKVENRMILSQTARLFAANMGGFPGSLSDYIVTTDADLWPLRKTHFPQPNGINRPLTLVHSECCDPFTFDGRTYPMLPMSHIGATAATWKEIVNLNSSILANDSTSILQYFQHVFGERVFRPVVFASDDWYLDQKLISIRVDQWINRRNGGNRTYKVSDTGLSRIDRSSWNTGSILPSAIDNYYDAHLPLKGFRPTVWESIKPLVLLMYNESSFQIEWFNSYAKGFYKPFIS